MDVGFTGTRKGMTEGQRYRLLSLIEDLPDDVRVHHGCCIGADTQFHHLVRAAKPSAFIVGHPPINTKYMTCGLDLDETRAPKGYKERNLDIVDESAILFATPGGLEAKQKRSGTWMTIRLTRIKVRPRRVIDLDGSVIEGLPLGDPEFDYTW